MTHSGRGSEIWWCMHSAHSLSTTLSSNWLHISLPPLLLGISRKYGLAEIWEWLIDYFQEIHFTCNTSPWLAATKILVTWPEIEANWQRLSKYFPKLWLFPKVISKSIIGPDNTWWSLGMSGLTHSHSEFLYKV